MSEALNYIHYDLSGSTLTPVITQTPIIKTYYPDGRENNQPNINFTLNDVSSATIQTIVRDYHDPYIWYLGGVENTKPTLYKIDISGNQEEDYASSSFDYPIINTDARIWKQDISGVVTHIQTDSNLQIFGIIQPYNPFSKF